MSILDYFKKQPSEMVLVSHDVLKKQQLLIEEYQKRLVLKDKLINELMMDRDLCLVENGGLKVKVQKLEKQLQFYQSLPKIDTVI
jgi:hypothetical protein